MIKKLLTAIMLFTITLSLNSCNKNSQEEIAEKNIMSFATAYFNWDFPTANKFTLKDSQNWLTFLASGITEKDIEAIRAKDNAASIEIENIDWNDSYATATISVYNYLAMDSIGGEPKLCQNNRYTLTIAKEDGVWKCGKPKIVK